ncbi:thioesterase family protein [Pseudanabaena sp. FACHB-2040]|uniref:acyl-CoA thioesterase n=1 Tax=Pseudanabaena sp. FACHB-2040 TaxID=2692859 RepID=UPI001686062D|nr:thioesterase family protein [Pseudanabaena sp. FACHB-2040]MBD2258878.1 acyl-CoA thioesterase [Pseudanabaena sp. FACHB-2040]
MATGWFDYPVRVQPHHTDYAGIVWHGTYVAWMEEARVEYLRSHQVNFADWVAAGIDLPVVDLSLRYRQSLQMGEVGVVRARVEPIKGIRIVWHFDIQQQETGTTCVLGTVTLAPVDRQTRKVLRRLPPEFQEILQALAADL